MKEHPILFSTQMVQAILGGRKKMTRRIIKNIPPESKHLFPDSDLINYGIGFCFLEPDQFELPKNEQLASHVKCRYGQPGDLLWVRESFKYIDEEKTRVDYKTQYTYPKYHKWKPSIHMPKAAARIWLEITEVKVERLQDITEKDAIAEGIEKNDTENKFNCVPCQNKGHNGADLICEDGLFYSAIDSFHSLWQAINGSESWNANPWVWVVEFRVLSKYGKPENLNLKPACRQTSSKLLLL